MTKKELKDIRISVRIPRSLKQLMEAFVSRDAHLNESDLVRDAIREKIRTEAPDLYAKLFQEAKSDE